MKRSGSCRVRADAFVLGAVAFALSTRALATPSYGDQGGYSVVPPYDSHSFTTLMTAFPSTTTRIIGGYPLASRLLAATGRTVSLQKTFGASDWLPVAVLDSSDPNMDPAFLSVTPDGTKIALGSGLSKPLYVFSSSLLSVETPVVLMTSPGARRYDLSYYSGAFRDDRYLFVNVGGEVLGQSDVLVIDTASPRSYAVPIISNIPGASAGIAFDAAGDLVTGIGWDADDSRTGEVAIFGAAALEHALESGASLDYDTAERVVAKNLLSADSLGFDAEGDLYVGGGDVFGSSGHYGYADVVTASVVSRVLAGGAPADPSVPGDITEIDPDPCKNDDWTGVTFVPGVDMLIVSANLASVPPSCVSVDWSTGATPTPVTLYFPPGAPDHDGDGIPDGADPDYETQEFFGRVELSRLVNALDATKHDPNYDASVDYDANGTIDDADFETLRAHWGLPISN